MVGDLRPMVRAIDTIIYVVLAYTVLMLGAEHLLFH